MAAKSKKTELGKASLSQEEHSRFRQRVIDNKADFKHVLALSIPQKKASDIRKLIRSYVDVFYQKGLKIKVVDDKYFETPHGLQFILAIEPLIRVTLEGKVINLHDHYVVIGQEIIGKKQLVSVDFYLNTTSKQEVDQMDKVISLLAKILEKKGFGVKKESLVYFEPGRK